MAKSLRRRAKPRRSSKRATGAPKAKATLAKLAKWRGQIARASAADVGMFGVTLRAATVKSLEFASFVHRRPAPADGFFLTATLRGICEDLIGLSFLEKLPVKDREQAISLLMSRSAIDGISAQAAFFAAERPWQPVLQPGSASVDSIDAKLSAISRGLGWTGRQAWPSVWFMAKACSLEAVYSYLYNATSRWVHFSPHLLLRMGWGNAEIKPDITTQWHFTTKNFSQYYTQFNRAYAVYLLTRLLRGPASGLLTARAADLVTELEGDMSEVIRWPEIVTYEEMNLKGPPPLLRMLLWAGYTEDSTSREVAV